MYYGGNATTVIRRNIKVDKIISSWCLTALHLLIMGQGSCYKLRTFFYLTQHEKILIILNKLPTKLNN